MIREYYVIWKRILSGLSPWELDHVVGATCDFIDCYPRSFKILSILTTFSMFNGIDPRSPFFLFIIYTSSCCSTISLSSVSHPVDVVERKALFGFHRLINSMLNRTHITLAKFGCPHGGY